MTNRWRVLPVVAALTVAAGFCLVTAAYAAEPSRNMATKKKPAQRVPEAAKGVIEKENDYTVRAHAADPSGDYKGYPNWARAALGSKYDD